MKTLLLTSVAALALSSCALTPQPPTKAIYDLGPVAEAAESAGSAALAWRIADVSAPPWLASDGIAYRLSYRQAQRLEHYRDSAWAAPPAALLTQRLRERLVASPGCAGQSGSNAALLTVNLDEFEQVFASPSSSQVVLRVHATLWPSGATGPALQQRWRLERHAAPDAAGAVQALAQAVDDWLPRIEHWLSTSACAR